jgi:hypothetical protein
VAKKKATGTQDGERGTRTAPKKQAAKPAAAERAFTSVELGNTAGEVWQALAVHGPQSLAGLKKQVGVSADLVAAAVGWLAREGKLSFRPSGRSTVIELREES